MSKNPCATMCKPCDLYHFVCIYHQYKRQVSLRDCSSECKWQHRIIKSPRIVTVIGTITTHYSICSASFCCARSEVHQLAWCSALMQLNEDVHLYNAADGQLASWMTKLIACECNRLLNIRIVCLVGTWPGWWLLHYRTFHLICFSQQQ